MKLVYSTKLTRWHVWNARSSGTCPRSLDRVEVRNIRHSYAQRQMRIVQIGVPENE